MIAAIQTSGDTMIADEDLFREWQKGNAAALEVLVQRYHTQLIAHLYRLVGNTYLAEDLAQETFVRLVRDAQAYRYPRPFVPWLYTIARNLALSYQTSAYQRHTELRSELPETFSHEPGPAEWFEHWEQHNDLQKALMYLSFGHREVLSLRFSQELNVKETADVLGLPVGTVKSRTFHALRLLRVYLERTNQQVVDTQGEHSHG
jgi:RNA polymerase sigma-70 factor, ECF subfamily